MRGVEPHPLTLAELLSIGMLIAATIEYAEILKRRIATRASLAERAEFHRRGLQGLVRIFLADTGPTNVDLARRGRSTHREARRPDWRLQRGLYGRISLAPRLKNDDRRL